jgi:hypothetical protein
MALVTAATQRRRGALMGDEEGRALVATADALMRQRGIKNPARFTAMLVPGFSDA